MKWNDVLNEDIWALDLTTKKGTAFMAFVAMAMAREPLEVTIDLEAATRPNPRRAGTIGVLPLHGILQYRPGLLSALFGATSLERWGVEFKRMVADDSVKAIILDIDSPGGGVDGLQELADDIYQARSQKPIIAVADTLAASAAYWLASSASEIVMSPSAEVGSIGVFAIHVDISKALDEMGIKPTLISAGKYKVEGNPYEPLTEEAEGAIKERVDDYYDAFVGAVARGRNRDRTTIRNGFGQGRIVGDKDAKQMGMVDRVATFEQTVMRWGGSLQPTAMAGWFPDLSALDIVAPYPKEHACRLRDPKDFQANSFRRTSRDSDGKKYDVIMGRLKGKTTMTEQAYRYPKGTWSEAEARKHCKEHKGQSFEPASEGGSRADWRARRQRLRERVC